MRKKIIVTGGTGRFSKALKKIKSNYNILYPNKKKLNITNYKKIKSYLKINCITISHKESQIYPILLIIAMLF